MGIDRGEQVDGVGRVFDPPYFFVWIGILSYINLSFQTWTFSGSGPGVTGGGYIQELTHFAQAILAGTQPSASLEDGYRALCVLEAIRESVRSGKPVSTGA
ncbi:MAG: Gfo/Idh/MocA family oxidoreductase [bacterium]|nr:Gfo/Idh/MocA family oxidoreductase [bacterium]